MLELPEVETVKLKQDITGCPVSCVYIIRKSVSLEEKMK